MPTVITHGVVGYLAAKMTAPALPPKLWLYAFACSIIPDLDSISFHIGIPYGHILGHRGFTHSPLFALLLALVVCEVGFRSLARFSRPWWRCFGVLALVTASHGVMDALTFAHKGVAFLFPFSDERFFFPWHLVPGASVGMDFFARPTMSLFVLLAEFQIFLLPLLLLWAALKMRAFSRPPHDGASAD